jgi:adenosylcobinamide kinase/adenosylcobinamide-phosphate guanylyltransferase
MGKLIVVTGGARSGKSSFAENTAKNFGDSILYIATSIPLDEEMQWRIRKHREQRPESWETLEAYREFNVRLKGILEDKDCVLLDCITIMLTNIMAEAIEDWNNLDCFRAEEIEKAANEEISGLLEVSEASAVPFILVTNEVGMGIVPEYPSARIFRDIAGRVNQIIAKAADEVYFCVSGIPIRIK